MTSVGIRNLKNHLSRYVRRVAAGERVRVTDRGRVVAELVPPGGGSKAPERSRYEELVALGVVRPALEPGDPLAHLPMLRLPPGTAAALIAEDRGEP
ncbi:MAG: type II toxin-antitoxin system prevent-host-death family antitoxin [Gemmatimonadetes bacterium]|nr:type II toxin-antitoxin system prevent-host-death family antitoxin [Gemmatimonadota bacterium]MBI2614907.1 type II toxin-antitoxin system prevent-host-death family antitoxin [Gemmatimonadota bacterium]MBI3081959.1 type II toxin-antitoxin system prevent-host-death family antitoxin [Gemmatimonadota bacterium]